MSTDPFKDGDQVTLQNFGEENMVLENNIYNKRTVINFKLLSPSSDADFSELKASDVIDTDIKEYTNTKILVPTKFEELMEMNPLSTAPTYQITTVTSEITENTIQVWSDSAEREYKKTTEALASDDRLTELYQAPFYTNYNTVYGSRNLVFHSDTTMAGSPVSDISMYSIYNKFFMTHPESGELSAALHEVDSQFSGDYGMYERFNILVGHYANSIKAINSSQDLSLDMIINSYDYPFPTDAYHVLMHSDDQILEYDVDQHLIFQSIIKTISKNSMSYSDIYNNVESPNEYLFYRIEKWFSETPTGPPDQVFFIPTTDWSKMFYDTQIKQGKYYYYRTTIFYAVMGSQYFFSDIETNLDGTGTCVANVIPRIQIYSMVSYEDAIINTAPPPMPPFISFHNKQATDNKIKIYLELQKGQEKTFYQAIESPQENLIGPEYYLPNGTNRFKYRKEPARFQIFRMSEKPNFYRDFSDNMIGDFRNNNMLENMIIMDKVQPNKKYYYIFRTVNEFGSFSNPSPVFEVQLIKDADKSRISVNSVLFNNDIPQLTEADKLNFRSLLEINVAPQQIEFDVSEIADADDSVSSFSEQLNLVNLGYSEDAGEVEHKIWGRKFKFRVRSNDSGKIIDFNVKVNLVKEENEISYNYSTGNSNSVQS